MNSTISSSDKTTRDVYDFVIPGSIADDNLTLETIATLALRAEMGVSLNS